VQPVHTALLRVYFGDNYYDVSRRGGGEEARRTRREGKARPDRSCGGRWRSRC